MRFIALDTETTGVDPRRDRIVQLHIREVTWPLLYTKVGFNIRLNPGIPIPAGASAVHGIRDEDVQDARCSTTSLDAFKACSTAPSSLRTTAAASTCR